MPVHVNLIAGADTTPIVLARDSDDRDEFWVYRPGFNWFNDSLGQGAGGITSPALTAYLRDQGF